MEYPKLRPIEIFPFDDEGKQNVCLRDPSNLSEAMVIISQQVLEIISLFDGKHSVLDIQAAYARRYGTILPREQVEGIIAKLDEGMLLESDGFLRYLTDLKDRFRRSETREAAFAGKGYESDPVELRKQLDRFFTSDGGPGKSLATRPKVKQRSGSVKGAVLPHIDLERGGPCFAWGYKEIGESSNAQCFIVLGTAHGHADGQFVLTKKDFETPFGILHTDKGMVNALEKAGGEELFKDEFVHKNEHSLEFQAIFLSYLYDGNKDITILPVLCSSFQEMIHSGVSPSSVREVSDFIETLRHVIRESGREVFLLASADLSHVGPRFGDPLPLTEQDLQEIAREDLDMIRLIENVDAEGFFRSIQKDGDKRKICGLAPIYVLLKLTETSRGKLLKYEQWPDPMGMVSFASICFY